ncbi:MAG: signal recognition particle-docking protein FtsY [Oligoflexia bacterium]|nr:signal recognition particle-docking protein FtsY [Oligoflexia bacterium]
MSVSLDFLLLALAFGGFLFFVGGLWLLFGRKKRSKTESEIELTAAPVQEQIEEQIEEKMEEVVEKLPPAKVSDWSFRLKKGLTRSREEIWGKIHRMLSGEGGVSKDQLEEIEALLYTADLGPKVVQELMGELTKSVATRSEQAASAKNFIFEFLYQKMQGAQSLLKEELFTFDSKNRPSGPIVIMVVGVNGAGKTTTIGKLAQKLSLQGARVIVAAADTFRAAAVDQLAVWCERANAKMIRAKEGSDPSGVAYEALAAAKKEGADYCIIDTAGRLHTKLNLMEELKKNKRVLQKLDESAPHHVLLVIDAVTGQNAIKQAQEFHSALGVTGLVFTKCDGSSKAGSAVGIVENLQIPIAYIGVGESVEDLDRFDLKEYLSSLVNA